MKDNILCVVIGILLGAFGMYYEHPLKAQSLYNQGMVDTMAIVCPPVTTSMLEAKKAAQQPAKK